MSTNMFGKTYNTIGSTDSNFIIKTKGDLKVQWGGKYIDIIKNGKLASNKINIFKQAESEELILNDGIYLIGEDQVWISIGGTKINLTESLTLDIYVSFMTNLANITPDLKYQSLTNAGFFYETLELAKLANLTKGIIYIELEHLLYYVNNGTITQYIGVNTEQSNKFSELYVNALHIFQDFAKVILNTDNLITFKIKQLPILSIDSSKVEITLPVIIHGDLIGNKYKLYVKNGLSYLEVDNIISKSTESIRPTESNKLLEVPLKWVYAENIINAQSAEGTIITCKTVYKNFYKNNDSIYLLMDNSAVLSYTDSTYYLSYPVPIDIVLKIGELIITIPKNTTKLTTTGGSEKYEIILGKDYLNVGSCKNKLRLWKFTVSNSTETGFTIVLPIEDPSFVERCLYISTCLSNKPLLTVDNEIKYSENGKTRTIIGDISKIELPKKTEKLTHGIFSENLISTNGQFYDSIFKKILEYPKYSQDIQLPENLKDPVYNSVVPNLQWVKSLIGSLFPIGSIIMFNGTSIPDGWAICDGTNGTPNLIGRFIKAGTKPGIINSKLNEDNELTLTADNLPAHTHPHQQHSHNLILSTVSGKISSEPITVSSATTFAYLLPTTEIDAVTEVAITDPSIEGLKSPIKVNLTKLKVINSIDPIYKGINASGTHSHNLVMDPIIGVTAPELSLEDDLKIYFNNPIKIEPRAYSLIFIMKIK